MENVQTILHEVSKAHKKLVVKLTEDTKYTSAGYSLGKLVTYRVLLLNV